MLRELLAKLAGKNPVPAIPAIPVIGCMATMPTRLASFERMLASILPQLDRLHVFLDGFAEVPDCLAGRPKCLVEHVPAGSGLHNGSRFLVPARYGQEAIYVFLDDDLLYPGDYVARLVAGLARHGHRAIVGFHGGLFRPPLESYVRDTKVLHFAAALKRDTPVDVLGSGTMAFHASVITPAPERWRHPRLDDLSLALDAVAAGVRLIALRRPARWLRPIAQDQEDSLWRSIKRDDSLPTRLMHDILACQAQATNSQTASCGPATPEPAGL